jgi:hypothetical protein
MICTGKTVLAAEMRTLMETRTSCQGPFLLWPVLITLALASACNVGPKQVILMIGDGMGYEQVVAAGMYQTRIRTFLGQTHEQGIPTGI